MGVNLLQEFAKKEMTRRQFVMSVILGFMGLTGVLRTMQEMSTPDNALEDPNVFGYGDYGNPDAAERK